MTEVGVKVILLFDFCYLNDPQLFVCLVIAVHESLVCPEQLNCLLVFRKILQVQQMICFSSIFVYLNPSQHWLYGFEIKLFTPMTTDGLICKYYRRFKRIEQNEDVYIFLVLSKWHIFSFSTALQKLLKIRTCFPEDKLNLPWYSNLKSFTPQLLMHVFFLLEYQ